jgi:2-oxoglutarate dehydrogenase E1 component
MTAESKQNRTPKGTSPNEVLDATSFLFGTNAAFIEGLYAQYLGDPNSVDGTWRAFFEALGDRGLSPTQLGRGPSWRRDAKLRTETSDFLSALTGDPGPAPKKLIATPIPPASWCAPFASSVISRPIWTP